MNDPNKGGGDEGAKLGGVTGNVKEHVGLLVGDETLEAAGAIQKHLSDDRTRDSDSERHPVYQVIAIYPTFAEAADALYQLKGQGFGEEQINLLGREQQQWQHRLGTEWEAHKTAKGALVGGALGAVPGLALVAGIALTGGVGLLVVGPMVGALSALGMGTVVGALMGAGSNAIDVPRNVEEEVARAIEGGEWVIAVRCYTDSEAAHARDLLPARRVIWENKTRARTEAANTGSTAEQVDMVKLAAVVDEAVASVRQKTGRPVEDVLSNVDSAESTEVRQAVEDALGKIATATGLPTGQIKDILREHRSADVNIVGVLRERSREAMHP